MLPETWACVVHYLSVWATFLAIKKLNVIFKPSAMPEYLSSPLTHTSVMYLFKFNLAQYKISVAHLSCS